MKRNLSAADVLCENELFSGLSKAEIGALIENIKTERKEYNKGEAIIRAGDCPDNFGIVLSGKVKAVGHISDGRESVFAIIGVGGQFADILAAAGKKKSPVSVFAEENGTEILSIPFEKLIIPEKAISHCQDTVIRNLFEVISMKYWGLMKKIEYMSVFPIKKRVFKYLSDESETAEKDDDGYFTVKFNREGMASYLNADRSALSRVLSELKSEGIIDFRKNRFRIN